MDLKYDYEKWRSASPIVPRVLSAPDTDVAFTLQYVPRNGESGTSTAATAAFTNGGDLTVTVDGAAPTGKDAFGTAGVYDTSAAAYDTVGEVFDAIRALGGNKHGAWRIIMGAALRSTPMASLLTKTATSCIGANGLTFNFDTSAAETLSTVISAEKFTNNGIGGYQGDWEHKVLNELLTYDITQDMASAGEIRIYQGKDHVAETLIYSIALADNTNTTLGLANPNVVNIQAEHGYRLIVQVYHATDIGAGAVGKYIVRGRSVVPDGSFTVRS
jgi:hypothetical protein